MGSLECADAIVATTFCTEGELGPTIINEAKAAVVTATETDRFLFTSVQGVPTAGNEKGIRYARSKDTLLNDIESIKTNAEKTNTALKKTIEKLELQTKRETAALKRETAALKRETAALKRETAALKRETADLAALKCEIAGLKTASEGYRIIRNRFLSVCKIKMNIKLLKSDHDWIVGGNAASHNGDCIFDAKLYFGTKARQDHKAYSAIYGLSPGAVSTTIGK
jgi:polyhydroxyalkanoate synthesis regulator phasin